jgi:uncharacterized membrane protein YhdT
VEVRIRDPAMILLVPICPGVFALPLLRPGLLMPLLFPPRLFFHVLPLLLLLHLAIFLGLLRMPVTALRLLSSFALRRHLVAISALRLLISPVIWPGLFLWPRLFLRPCLLLPILWVRIVLLVVPVLVLRDGGDRRSQQK